MNTKIVEAILLLQEVGKSTPELDAQLAEMQAAENTKEEKNTEENTDENTKETTETETAEADTEKAAVPEESVDEPEGECLTIDNFEAWLDATQEAREEARRTEPWCPYDRDGDPRSLASKPIPQLTAEDFALTSEYGIYKHLLNTKPEIEADYLQQAQAVGAADVYRVNLRAARNGGIKTLEDIQAEDFDDPDFYYTLARMDEMRLAACKYQYRQRAKEYHKQAQYDDMYKIADKRVRKEREEEAKEARRLGMARKEANRQQEIESLMTEYTDLPDWITGNKPIGPSFAATDDGIEVMKETHDGRYFSKISDKPMLINRIAGVGNDRLVELAVREQGGHWVAYILPLKTLCHWQRVNDLIDYGIMIDPDDSKYVARYFQKQYDLSKASGQAVEVPRVDVLGFNANFNKFFFGDETDIMTKGLSGLQASLVEMLKPVGDREKWYEAMRELRKTKVPMMHVALIANLAGPLISMLGIDGFWINIYGPTRKGKTQATILAGSVWGDMRKGKLLVSIKGSAAGKEDRLAFLNNIPVTFDDFNNLTEREKEDLGETIMFVANGIGRQLGSKGQDGRPVRNWASTSIGTSEYKILQLAKTGGIFSRLLSCKSGSEFPWDPDWFDKIKKTLEANRGWAGRDFVRTLINFGRDKISELWRNEKDLLRKRATEAGRELQPGQLDAGAVMMVADQIASSYLFKDDIKFSTEDILALMEDEGDANPSEKFYESLTNYFYANAAHFENAVDNGKQKLESGFYGVYIAEKILKNKTSKPPYMCYLPSIIEELARKSSVDLVQFYDWAEENGLLVAEHEKTGRRREAVHTDSVYLDKKPRMVRIALQRAEAESKAWAGEHADNDIVDNLLTRTATQMPQTQRGVQAKDVLLQAYRDLAAVKNPGKCKQILRSLGLEEWRLVLFNGDNGRRYDGPAELALDGAGGILDTICTMCDNPKDISGFLKRLNFAERMLCGMPA